MHEPLFSDANTARAASGGPAGLSDGDRQTLLDLARRALLDYLGGGKLTRWETQAAALLQPRATFVTLRRRDTGELRGCRGERSANRPLIESVVLMAIAAATDDPRFPPVTIAEVPDLHIEINALTPLEPIKPDDVVVGRHGLLIVQGHRLGLLLPSVPINYKWDRERFLEAVCWKAGLPEDAWRGDEVELYGFESEAWGED